MPSVLSVSGKKFFQIRKHKAVHEKITGTVPVSREKENPETVYSNEYVIISFDRDSRILRQEWKGFCPGGDFRAAIDFSFNFMTENNINKTLCDVRHQRVVPPSCQKYVEEKVLEYIKNYGSFYTAFVAFEKSVGGVCARLYDMNLTRKLGYRANSFFDNEYEAETWLSKN